MRSALSVGLLGLVASAVLPAQHISTPPQIRLPSTVDSGYLHNGSSQARVVFSERITLESAPWMQLAFAEQVNLPTGSFLRMTATRDAAVQRHTGVSLAEWGGYSAFFNGEEVLLELVAGPNTRSNRVAVAEIVQGLEPAAGTESLCGADDRILSTDPRQGRLTLGCTGWLAGADLMLTAGHCTTSGSRILELNVPLSTNGGGLVRSAPNDQYPYTTLAGLNGGIGADWQVARMGRNSNTNLLPTEANGGVWYTLGTVPGSTAGQNIRITGYGTVSSPVSPTWQQVQKTHFDALTQIGPDFLRYIPDTTGGNSGSPVIHENTGHAIGIHTHAGCDTGGNHGTRIDRSDLQQAIRNAGITPGSFQTYGIGCAGSGSTGGQCAGINANGGSLSGATTGNEYAYPIASNSPLQLAGFEVYARSTSGGQVNVPVSLFLDAGGVPSSNAAATGTLTVGGSAGWYGVTFANPINVPAGTFYVAVDNTGSPTVLSDLNSGTPATAYWRRPGQSWAASGVVTTPAARAICVGGGSGGAVPGMAGAGAPEIGQTMDLNLRFAAPNTTAVAFTGVSNTVSALGPLPFALDGFGAAGCSILASLDIDVATPTDAQGTASIQIPVPNDANLVGFHLYHQYVVIDPAANTLGIALSNAVETTIGG